MCTLHTNGLQDATISTEQRKSKNNQRSLTYGMDKTVIVLSWMVRISINYLIVIFRRILNAILMKRTATTTTMMITMTTTMMMTTLTHSITLATLVRLNELKLPELTWKNRDLLVAGAKSIFFRLTVKDETLYLEKIRNQLSKFLCNWQHPLRLMSLQTACPLIAKHENFRP